MSTNAEEPFRDKVERCREELDEALFSLMDKHGAQPLIAALTQELGYILWAAQRKRYMNPQTARRAIKRIEFYAFHPFGGGDDGEPMPSDTKAPVDLVRRKAC